MLDIVKSKESIDDLINTSKMVLILFGNKTCGVCRSIKPRIIDILKKYPEIKSIYVDVGELPEVAAFYNFFTVPGIVLFINGKETIREAGSISLRDLDNKILRYYSLLFE